MLDDDLNILIAGDSFAADWTVKYPEQSGWPNMLAEQFSVRNIAQAGVSEYKIYQQIMSVDNLNNYDVFILSHTSPYRMVTRKHPVHHSDVLHEHADLILSDINYHSQMLKSLFNPSLRAAQAFIHYHYDSEYHETVFNLFKEKINKKLPKKKTIVIDYFSDTDNVKKKQHLLNFKELQKTHPGLINHLSHNGNKLVFQQIVNYLQTHI